MGIIQTKALAKSTMNLPNFLATITEHDVILTVNRRLATYLQKSYDAHQVQLQKSAWISLQVMPLGTWVEHIWEKQYFDTRMLLTDFQELKIWEEVINESPISEGLLNLTGIASLAQQTWKLINQWQLNLELLESSLSPDVNAFVTWTKLFQKKCHRYHVLSRNELLNTLINKFPETLTASLPLQFYFVGFDDIAPALQNLQQVLQAKTIVKNIQFSLQDSAVAFKASYLDEQTELQEMARWAYKKILTCQGATIGCILPNLAEKRRELFHIFNHVFYAEKFNDYFKTPPFNISSADNLNHFPLIEAALKILQLNFEEIDIEDMSSLLRSPFIKDAIAELPRRAKLDVRLRRLGEKKLVRDYFFTSDLLMNSCSSLHQLLQNFSKSLQKDSLKSLTNWSALFVKQLSIMGWPGDRSLDSTEFQLVERFKKLFGEFNDLAQFFPELNLRRALTIFKQLVSSTLFQPKTDDMPIQVLGVLEASGIAFNALWVAGLNNETWPAPCAPNPFIPVAIQKKFNMPHASSERELQFSLNVTKRLLQNSEEVIFSYAKTEQDRPLMASTLIADYPLKNEDQKKFISLEEQIYATREMEYLIDNQGPAIQDGTVTGGSGLFKAQAACPFQAFAKYRLYAEPIDDTQIGLAFHERGSLVHIVLAGVWSRIKDHEQLCSLTDYELNDIVRSVIDDALQRIQSKKPFTLKKGLIALEKKRLQKLIFNWLQHEKLRQPFEVVSCEQKQMATIGRLEIHIQIDRIDKLSNGKEIIIDYKTGQPSILDWFSERPLEPQLPLYTIALGTELCGILFAEVRIDTLRFKGITTHNDIAPGAITVDRLKEMDFQTFPSVIQYWQTTLRNLAEDFSQGNAAVNPKNTSSCQYCQLQAFCRINMHENKSIG